MKSLHLREYNKSRDLLLKYPVRENRLVVLIKWNTDSFACYRKNALIDATIQVIWYFSIQFGYW